MPSRSPRSWEKLAASGLSLQAGSELPRTGEAGAEADQLAEQSHVEEVVEELEQVAELAKLGAPPRPLRPFLHGSSDNHSPTAVLRSRILDKST